MASRLPKLSIVQSELFWVFVCCLAAKIWLSTDDAEKQFSTGIQMMRQINGSVLWLTAILSGKRTIDFILKVRKLPETITEIDQLEDGLPKEPAAKS